MNIHQEAERQYRILSKGLAEILPGNGLREKLELSIKQERPLRVKLGIDPTTRNIHIGHMVPYRKLREFQDLGHTAVLIIGDFTAMIGDPTGKNKERPGLTKKKVHRNAETYCSQIFKVIDEDRAEVHFQSSWFEGKSLRDAIEKASEFSVAHLLSHETFRSRLERGVRLSLHELFYPLLQAWDSLEINADIEMGGMDQKFNILCGRDLQKNRGVEPQTSLFLPLLAGMDRQKMSKSTGNAIAVLDSPEEMYGKVMSIPDDLLDEYIHLACSTTEGFSEDPYTRKKQVAKDITEIYHGKAPARTAEEFFRKTVSLKEIPEEIPCTNLTEGTYSLVSIITDHGLAVSKSESRRLIQQGAVRLDSLKISDTDYKVEIQAGSAILLKAGKRKYLKIQNLKGSTCFYHP